MIDINPTRVDERAIIDEYIKDIDEIKSKKLKSLNLFATKSFIFLTLLFLVLFIGLIYDALQRVNHMLVTSPTLAAIYLTLFTILTLLILYMITKQYLSYKKLKKIGHLQEQSLEHLKNPTKLTQSFAKEILQNYQNYPDKDISQNAKELLRDMDTLMYEEILPTLKSKIFMKLDEKAKKAVTKYSTQTAISTAISPVALIDAILILSRSYAMISEIAQIYGYRPTFFAKLALIRRVFVTLAFASISDILSQHSHDFLGSSLLSKLSYHSAQAIANGVLTARVGISTIKSCRPIIYSDKNRGFLINLSKAIIDTIFSNKKNK